MQNTSTFRVDISREYTCFLCNGIQTMLGSIKLEETFIVLSAANGLHLEDIPYTHLVSVTNEEPITTHSLFLNMRNRSVYISHLVRKDKLVKCFKQLGLFKEDIRLPAEALGFISGNSLKKLLHPDSELFSELPYSDERQTPTTTTSSNQLKQTVNSWEGLDSQIAQNLSVYSNHPRSSGTTTSGVSSTTYYSQSRHQQQQQQFTPMKTSTTSRSQDVGQSTSERPRRTAPNPPASLPPHTASVGTAGGSSPRQAHRTPPAPRRINEEEDLQKLQKLFPNHSRQNLQHFLRESNFDLEVAMNSLLVQDNFATTTLSSSSRVTPSPGSNATPSNMLPNTEDQAQGWGNTLLGAVTNGSTPITTAHPPNILSLWQPDRPSPSTVESTQPKVNIARLPNGDLITAKCKQHLWEICKEHKHDDLYPNLGIVAGFLLCENNDIKNSVVVALGSGTKCLCKPFTDQNGYTLLDMHAVVIARRALLKFLYTQVANAHSSNSSIFVFSDGKLKLNDCLSLHLYISTVPCGDARVFETIGGGARASKLRVKHKDSLDTNPIQFHERETRHLTFETLADGPPVYCMSCSDKIALWNTVGVQGALLGRFMHPLFIQSITVGARAMSTEQHLERAFISRMDAVSATLQPLQRGSIVRPRIFIPMKYNEEYRASFPPDSRIGVVSLNWYSGAGIERVDPVIGKCDKNHASRLSKNSLYKEFDRLRAWADQSVAVDQMDANTYHCDKGMAREYQERKQIVRESLEGMGCGHWAKKPKEIELFTL